MKKGLLITVLGFAITLTAIFGIRASTDALAVILGVILGVAASVPTTFLVTYILTRSGHNHLTPSIQQQMPVHPPVVVINAPEKPTLSSTPTLPLLTPTSQTRKWTVIGDTETPSD
jgi:hypothetical protein